MHSSNKNIIWQGYESCERERCFTDSGALLKQAGRSGDDREVTERKWGQKTRPGHIMRPLTHAHTHSLRTVPSTVITPDLRPLQTDPVPCLQRPPTGPRAATFTTTKQPLSSAIPRRRADREAHKDGVQFEENRRKYQSGGVWAWIGWRRERGRKGGRKRGANFLRILSALLPRGCLSCRLS